ncbi:RNA polymerase sigma factor [Planobispora siamensis]|uniref:RNA polymerase sigma factor n=1 Tax=Planobispora siamensis TaxID=936338 RepID=A0A8J3S7N8_9ACTN|nr:sigma-70 family RNA polymerase sigma factor [Planobispora siamensis]GIH89801.1 RNA polymerase sigma factor [Planobispora siamensis]
MTDTPTVTALVVRAREGDQDAWNELVDRYAPLVWSICRRYGLARTDIDDVAQNVWLRAVGQLKALREPAALPGWLATTTKHECSRVFRARRRQEGTEQPLDFEMTPDDESKLIEQELEAAERNAVLRAAFAELSATCQQILLLRMEGVPYEEIGARLGMSIGSIGPTRARCLEKLRADPALVALMTTETSRSEQYG